MESFYVFVRASSHYHVAVSLFFSQQTQSQTLVITSLTPPSDIFSYVFIFRLHFFPLRSAVHQLKVIYFVPLICFLGTPGSRKPVKETQLQCTAVFNQAGCFFSDAKWLVILKSKWNEWFVLPNWHQREGQRGFGSSWMKFTPTKFM